MKKSILVLIVLAAVVVLVSPALIGRIAERAVDDNLGWAETEFDGFSVRSLEFDRRWFYSDGRHRVEITDPGWQATYAGLVGDERPVPVIVIDTRLDHGLVPVSSLARDEGSLSPGLGNAVSTVSLEFDDGERLELPGRIHSRIGLGGNLTSTVLVDAGTLGDGDEGLSWLPAEVRITTRPGAGAVEFDAELGGVSAGDASERIVAGPLAVSGEQRMTRFGFTIGTLDVALESLAVEVPGAPGVKIRDLVFDSRATLEGDRIDSGGRVSLLLDRASGEPGSINLSLSMNRVDAASFGRLYRQLGTLEPDADPMQQWPRIESDLLDVLAAGLALDVERLEVTRPGAGTLTAALDLRLPQSDPATFGWSTALLAVEGSADVAVPVAIVDALIDVNPEIRGVIAAGFLKKDGEIYRMQAAIRKGLMTVNGAPFPLTALPLGD